MTYATSRGEILARFSEIRIEHPRLIAAHKTYDSLRLAKKLAPREPQRFAALFAPPQSGKTMSIKTYIETRVVDDAISLGLFPADMDRAEIAERQRLVLHVTLSAKATVKSLASDILTAFRDPRPSQGTAESLLKRAYDYMRHYGTSLLLIDEIQHLGHRMAHDGRKGTAWRSGVVESSAVTDTLKCMLLNGLVPMVFVGITEARPHLFCDPQLSARCIKSLDFERLDFSKPSERTISREYCGTLGLKLKQHRLFEEESFFVVGDIPSCLHEVAGGRLGMASNLVLAACQIAQEQQASCVTREHLSIAVEEWAIPMGIVDYNPFVEGLRELKRRAA